jgi:hypothetical protein
MIQHLSHGQTFLWSLFNFAQLTKIQYFVPFSVKIDFFHKRTKYTRHYTDTPYIKLSAKRFNKTYNNISERARARERERKIQSALESRGKTQNIKQQRMSKEEKEKAF